MRRFRSIEPRWLQRHFEAVTREHTQMFLMEPGTSHWEPVVNVYRCDHAFCVCVDLAGVAKNQIELTVEPGRPHPRPRDRHQRLRARAAPPRHRRP